MTRYSRSVIPGRPKGEDGGSDIDRLVFGKGGDGAAPSGDGEPDFLPPAEVGDLIDRANSDRRKIKRRKGDFAPLPEEGRSLKADEGAKRGPMLLVGALVIVAVFGVVVWNAYRDGVKPEDSSSAIELASSGSFKSKPEESKAKGDGDVQAGVFDQIEKTKPLAEPAPEVREQPAASVAPPPLAGAPAETKSEPTKAEPVKAEPAKAAAPVAPVKMTPPAQVKTAVGTPAPAAAATMPPKPVVAAADNAPLPVSP
ncbi:MAG TPA: hypothetical protein VG942_05325, partial [Hyphomonadaceae bacterium]|nr:hypothetical protein [Hyphomonadaceae bacterium]